MFAYFAWIKLNFSYEFNKWHCQSNNHQQFAELVFYSKLSDFKKKNKSELFSSSEKLL